jgi:hypothetical protein
LLGDSAVAEKSAVVGAQIRAERGVAAACDALERALSA